MILTLYFDVKDSAEAIEVLDNIDPTERRKLKSFDFED